MSAVKPIMRELRQAVLNGMAHSKDKLHQLIDNMNDHLDTIVKRVKDKDHFDDKPDMPSAPDRRPYLTPGSRPSLRKSTIRDVWNNAKDFDGKVREPYPPYSVINWTPGTSRRGVWDMGHLPEHKYHEKWQEYVDGGMTPKEFRDWYNDPTNYRPELPGPNRGHQHE